MASSSTHQQLKRIKVLVERAAREPFATPVRREAFEELIELTHSSHPALKSYAAGNIHVFFNDFLDLEEDAINAVYDLCEDQDSKVRMCGYHAVTQVSSVQYKWVKRNADVLVQLLQSDEPEEVAVVKTALLAHLDMDPPITLGVLCDQIVPPGEDPDDDERQTRERLRSLVLSFLATDAMNAIQKYTDPPGSEAEHILVAQLILAISRLDTDDVDVIVKDILLRLPRSRDSTRGDELLQVILDKVTTLLQTRSNDPAQLKAALHYLSVAHMATVDFHAIPAIKLLQFYISSLTRKLVLQKFPPEDRIQVISWIVDALLTSERESTTYAQQVAQLRRQVIDASSILLEVLFDSKLYRDDLWRSVKCLLNTIKTRKEMENWTLPPYLIAAMSKFLQVLSGVQTQEDASEVQSLIRVRNGPLYPSPLTPDIFFFSSFEQLLAVEQPSSSKVPIQEAKPIIKNGVPPEWPAHLPPRPVTSPLLMPTKLDLPIRSAPIQDNASRHPHVVTVPTSPKRTGNAAEDAPQPKRAKMDPGGQDTSMPSLLSRIAAVGDTSSTGRPNRPGDRPGWKRKKHSGKGVSSPEPDRHPSTGYSIKGAANAQRNENGLLYRMGGGDSG